MKTEKLSLSSIKNVLSRAEMKMIMAGSGTYNCQCEGTKGTWSGTYSSQSAADASAAYNCRYGGSCGLA
jgi:hypothetical protein